jgi:hypothetical protein
MRVSDQLDNSLRFASQGNHPFHIASKAGLAYSFFSAERKEGGVKINLPKTMCVNMTPYHCNTLNVAYKPKIQQ